MMTQTASIQCAFDYSDPDDWKEKFRLAALLAPVASALFANSPRVDGADSGYRSYRAAIWRETDPARCGIPRVVFQPHFGLEAWLDYLLDVPAIFRHRSRGLVPTGGTPFRDLLELSGCDAPGNADWETHISTIFTEVRAYTYIEVRSADLLPDDRAFEVPTFWTGLLYDDDARREALARCSGLDDYEVWREALDQASKRGLEASPGGVPLRDLAADVVRLAIAGLRGGASRAGDGNQALQPLLTLARANKLDVE
jgi:glutamate--cysteine ligase